MEQNTEREILSDAIEHYIEAERTITEQRIIIGVLTVLCCALAFLVIAR